MSSCRATNAKPSCAGCDCGVPVRNGMHEEPTDIPDTVYVYPCRAYWARVEAERRAAELEAGHGE